ncbi:MAG: periplasmic heavy metal sensor [Alphaproteobacteria bacterium]|nr:periplasmic heavy metal sensor [Alphaproteobacteria bacterium]
MSVETAPTPRGRRSWLLIASLCLNFFLIGLIVAGLLAFAADLRFGRPGSGASPFHPRMLVEMLPPDSRAKIREAMAERRPVYRPLIHAARRARLEAYGAFTAEPFDPAAFDAAMTKIRETDAAVQAAGQAFVTDLAARLSPEERAIVARKIRERRGFDRLEERRDDEPDMPQ